MREGMQVESASIPIAAKIELLDLLSTARLNEIVVGSFVSPRWTPQMAGIDELISRFTPVEGVRYTAIALNDRGRERMRAYVPPLAVDPTLGRSMVNACDVFAQRNTNATQAQEIERLPEVVASQVAAGVTHAKIGLASAFGSNWLGDFTDEGQLLLLDHQWRTWEQHRVPVTGVLIADTMGWNTPWRTVALVRAIKARWPEVSEFHLHLHDARGTALASALQVIETLDSSHSVVIDSAVGGMGGCPYSGHGQLTRMIPSEDLVDILHEMGISTGVDLDRLIEAAVLAERVVGHPLWGHVSKAGPRPRGHALFPMDLPVIETADQAAHFRLGPTVYAEARRPWSAPITSLARSAVERNADG